LLKKDVKFEWTLECEDVLNQLINCINQDLVLIAPDEDRPFELETDALAYAVGAALFQKDDRGKH